MRAKNFMFAANWKAYLTYEQVVAFCQHHATGLARLASTKGIEIALFPSFEVLYPVIQLFAQTEVSIGAQDCSAYGQGAYTGQVSAPSLAELGCSYALVGHSERRSYAQEDVALSVRKVACLMDAGIEPILCIGEQQHEYMARQTYAVLERQLVQLFEHLLVRPKPLPALCIAYEPVWAIGTNEVPASTYIQDVLFWIADMVRKMVPDVHYRLLYGGSVQAATVEKLHDIHYIDGFLIGGASLDFKKFQDIVSLWS